MATHKILLQQTSPRTSRPWRIAETLITSDGLRTRFCDGTWATEEEARKELEKDEAQ